MSHSNIKNNLLELGFSPHDAEIYLALIKKGPCAAGPLISETKLHRNIVYTSLDHLSGRKLVWEKIVSGRKYFSIAAPIVLEQEFAHKARIAKEAVGQIRELTGREIPEITVHQGNEEYLSLLTIVMRQLPKGSMKYVLGTGGEEFMKHTMLPIWKKYHEVARARKIKIKMISYEHQRSSILPYVKKEGIYDIRFLPSSIENPAGVHVYPAIFTVLNIIYSNLNTPVTAMKVVNHNLSQSYLNLFENLWKMGKK